MVILLDANILLRLAEPGHPHHTNAYHSTEYLSHAGNDLNIVPQSLYEFWTVATRPKNVNGLGLTVAEAGSRLVNIKATHTLINDDAKLYATWEQLDVNYLYSGKAAYDARLVAAMQLGSVPAILTFNVTDFNRYPNIIVLDPRIEAMKYVPALP